MIFLLGCILSKTDVSIQQDDMGHYNGSFRQHALLLELMGPSGTVEIGPEHTRIAVGGSLGLGPFWEDLCMEEDWCNWLGPTMHYSVLGLQALEYQREGEEHYFGVASPYAQLHIPFNCSSFEVARGINVKTADPCLSLFGSIEYQNRFQAPNQTFLGVGLSYGFILY